MRLSTVLAIVKHDWSDDTDAYGEIPLGVVCSKCKWIVAYDLEPAQAADDNIGNIDHVIPKSQGGSNRLANLQLMHVRANRLKGACQTPGVEQDYEASSQVCRFLLEGLKTNHDNIVFEDRFKSAAFPFLGYKKQQRVSSFEAWAKLNEMLESNIQDAEMPVADGCI